MASLPTWSEFSPPLPSSDVQTGDPESCTDEYEGVFYTCTMTPCSITETPEKITTFNPGSSILWLGSLIQGSTYLGGLGTMEELPIRQRAPLTISIDLLFPDNTRTIEDPSLSSVTQAVGELITAAQDAGHVAGSTLDFQKQTCYSLSQGMLKMGLSFAYMGSSASMQLEFGQTVEQSTVTAFFRQRMFTASVELPQTPDEFFSSEFTQDRLDEQIEMGRIGQDNVPVYVSNIVYGRILVMTMTSSYSQQEMKAALDATYSSTSEVGVDVDAGHLQVLNESEIKVIALGGEAEHALALIRTGDLNQYFASDAALTSAAPISYTLLSLADNSVAKVSEMTEYSIRECSAVEAVAYYDDLVLWRDAVEAMTNGQVKEFLTDEEGVEMAEEVDAPSWWEDWINYSLDTSELSFNGATTGLPLDFSLRALEYEGITFNDDAFGFPWSLFPMLSIGDATWWHDNDNFDIRVTRTDPGCTVFAVGTYVGDNEYEDDEFLRVFGENDTLLKEFTSGLPYADDDYNFMGVVSLVPITRFYFNEDNGGDDICIQHFYFGVLSE
jgi:hypothetical protein